MAGAIASNISGDATIATSNIFGEAMRGSSSAIANRLKDDNSVY